MYPEEVMTLGEIFICIVLDTSKLMLIMTTVIGVIVYFFKPLVEWLKDLFGSDSNKT